VGLGGQVLAAAGGLRAVGKGATGLLQSVSLLGQGLGNMILEEAEALDGGDLSSSLSSSLAPPPPPQQQQQEQEQPQQQQQQQQQAAVPLTRSRPSRATVTARGGLRRPPPPAGGNGKELASAAEGVMEGIVGAWRGLWLCVGGC
jgi:hypothetical protein